MPIPDLDQMAIDALSAVFARNGYVRRQKPERLTAGSRVYKKGEEVRLVAYNWVELGRIRRMLSRLEFEPGRPYKQGQQWRLPIYGRAEVARFLSLMETANPIPEPPPPEPPGFEGWNTT